MEGGDRQRGLSVTLPSSKGTIKNAKRQNQNLSSDIFRHYNGKVAVSAHDSFFPKGALTFSMKLTEIFC